MPLLLLACGTTPSSGEVGADTRDPPRPDDVLGLSPDALSDGDTSDIVDASPDLTDETDSLEFELDAETGLPPSPAFEEHCSDGTDNDGDGRTDCADLDCAEDSACAPETGWTRVVVGGHHTCGVRSDGQVYCWGLNIFGETGTDPELEVSFSRIEGLEFPRAIGLGFLHTCAIDGVGRPVCWGANGGGFHNYGTERTTTVWAPTPFGDAQIDAVAIEVDEQHACALLADRTVECWGMNSWGQLGDGRSQGTPQNQRTPVVGVSEVIEIGVGFGHTCALERDGQVYCWGANGVGELGDGSTEIRLEPVLVACLPPVVALGTGAHHTCAVSAVGEVWCWGWDDRTFTESVPDTPRRIDGVSSAVDVSDGGSFSCALKADGVVLCWGNERSPFSSAPAIVFEGARSISAGSAHACAAVGEDEIRCVGESANGQTEVPEFE